MDWERLPVQHTTDNKYILPFIGAFIYENSSVCIRIRNEH